MIKINVRNFTRHASEYMERVRKGEAFVIMKRNEAVADIIPHNKKDNMSNWSRKMPQLKIRGLSMSQELVNYRQQERS